MKLFVAFAALVAAVSGKRAAPAHRQTVELRDIKADSPLGNKVMESARRLDQTDGEVDYTWVAGYSIKFQGCHQISQWNDEADGEEDVKIQTKRLVRFRLCPEGSCSEENAGGCDSGYGEYILDMNIFLEAWLQAEQEHFELLCETYAYAQCQNNDDEDTCLWDYLESIGMDPYKCVEQNPYNQERRRRRGL